MSSPSDPGAVPWKRVAATAAGRAGLAPTDGLPERELTAALSRIEALDTESATAAIQAAAEAGELVARPVPDGFEGSETAYAVAALVDDTDRDDSARSSGPPSAPPEADPADPPEPAESPDSAADEPGSAGAKGGVDAREPAPSAPNRSEAAGAGTDTPVRAERADTRLLEAGPDGPGVYIGPSSSGSVADTAPGSPGWLAPDPSADSFRWALLSRLDDDAEFQAAVRELRGSEIACDCSDPEGCHGRVVLEYLDKHTEPRKSPNSAGNEPGSAAAKGGVNTPETPEHAPDSATAGAAEWREAFAAAVEWYHAQLDTEIPDHTASGEHPDRPTTARDYFTGVRGWGSSTLDEKRLGYAPAGGGLRDYLESEGFEPPAIRATGLFTEDLRPLWRGRYVFPYFDADGEPVYAIARVTGGRGGGAAGYDGHPEDYLPGKYAKLAHTKEYVQASEPIYGTATLEHGEPVVITEGMADAISAHAAGIPCLSPVTTKFKKAHHDPLRALLAKYGVPRVYIIQDNDPPATELADGEGWEALETRQVAPGIDGALRTADYLESEGYEVRVAVPPSPAAEKVDFDDYLTDGWGSVDALAASSKPATAHPAYGRVFDGNAAAPTFGGFPPADAPHADPAASSSSSTDSAGGSGSGLLDDTSDGGAGQGSALFDLSPADVLGVGAGYRGPNPIAPEGGESENYFVMIDADAGDPYGYDHKRKAAFHALPSLLVKATDGGRRPSDVAGELDDGEIWVAWKQAHADSLLPDGDPVPYRALLHIARKHDLAPDDAIPDTYTDDGPNLSQTVYNRALEAIRDEHGLDPGRSPAGSASPSRSELGLDDEPTTRDEKIQQIANEILYQKHGGE